MIGILIWGLTSLSAIEAVHDATIELIQDGRQIDKIKKWHTIDFLYHLVLSTLLALLLDSLWVFPIYASIRYIVFNTLLNIIRDRPIFYLGTTSRIDKFFRRMRLLPFILSLIVLIISVYYA